MNQFSVNLQKVEVTDNLLFVQFINGFHKLRLMTPHRTLSEKYQLSSDAFLPFLKNKSMSLSSDFKAVK